MIKFSALILLSSLCGYAFADDPVVTVFGQPLGGQIKITANSCPTLKEKTKTICWIERPRKYSGATLGMVGLPEAVLPLWAIYSLPYVSIQADGKLSQLSFKGLSLAREREIQDSISARFGAASSANKFVDGSLYKWWTPEIFITLLCSSENCTAEFWSKASYREHAEQSRLRQEKDLLRPKTP